MSLKIKLQNALPGSVLWKSPNRSRTNIEPPESSVGASFAKIHSPLVLGIRTHRQQKVEPAGSLVLSHFGRVEPGKFENGGR